METIKELYKIGFGPSSSHTMGPAKAAQNFKKKFYNADKIVVTLYGSLAATGKGHFTDKAIINSLYPTTTEIIWRADIIPSFHPNGMLFEAFKNDEKIGEYKVYSVGGGKIVEEGENLASNSIYPLQKMDDILEFCEKNGYSLWEYVELYEGKEIWGFLREIYRTMLQAIENGLKKEGVIPGGLGLQRKSYQFHIKSKITGPHLNRFGTLTSYALAVSEENATGGIVVTAPTCGSCGILPAVLKYVQDNLNLSEDAIIRALATAGLVGNIVKHNGSISGAEVGCQGEVGTACAMAAAAASQLMGGTIFQIEYAAEMGLEHNLGLTCDPVNGLVQIPCIERNVFAASKALNAADYALFSDGKHRVSFDKIIQVMVETGKDLPSPYRETAEGGLAKFFHH
ncbi:MAG TPA: L-serine ammonia-lyase [Ignavibacteriales bacterium]|nr:L-serine ammonia-lyase [Ignavibacteriales bacterium]HPD67376.1 L-serine ammonia-lyase [Ignavibacteriales bacterium]HRR18781.1 L-serine ammonia-lyase [Ignavibacteriales bacterium]HRT99256.1 L-serine ammonia-lyase [Ignavibacteriales bacterium]